MRPNTIDAEEEQQSVPGCRIVMAAQGGVFVGAPLMKAKQHGPVVIHQLREVNAME